MHTVEELQEKQALPLNLKIMLTRDRVRSWIKEFGENGVYISFSGGKDSTVLLDLVRNEFGYKDVPAMFVDVPTQYPELRQFVKTFDNVDIVQPKINFFQVCEKHGFPLFGKEISECVQGARKYLTSLKDEQTPLTDRQTDRQTDRTDIGLSECKEQESMPIRTARVLGVLTKDNKIKEDIPSDDRSAYSLESYKFMLDAPFEISNKCCNVMKKEPAHRYAKETGRMPITAQMASESRLRTQKWLQNGCNAFHTKNPISNPMSFWTEQDVLRYIKDRDLKICSVYGQVVSDYEEMGQMQLSDYGFVEFDRGPELLHCTGCDRTGCVLCGFGAHIQGDDRFVKLRETHPGMYKLLDVVKNNGYTMREAINWVSDHSNKIIKI